MAHGGRTVRCPPNVVGRQGHLSSGVGVRLAIALHGLLGSENEWREAGERLGQLQEGMLGGIE